MSNSNNELTLEELKKKIKELKKSKQLAEVSLNATQYTAPATLTRRKKGKNAAELFSGAKLSGSTLPGGRVTDPNDLRLTKKNIGSRLREKGKNEKALAELLEDANNQSGVDQRVFNPRQLATKGNLDGLQEMPSSLSNIESLIARLNEQSDELREKLNALIPPIEETHAIVKVTENKLDNIGATVGNKLDKLSGLVKQIRNREGSGGQNIIIYLVSSYYAILFAIIRLSLELTWLMARTGSQWGNTLLFYGFGIPHLLTGAMSYILFWLIVQGGVLAIIPVPQLNFIYNVIFNEDMLLSILTLQFGVVIRHMMSGVWRARALIEPGNRITRSFFVGLLGIDQAESVSEYLIGLVRGPAEYVSESVIGRIVSGVSAYLPDVTGGVSGAASTVATGVSGVASTVATGVSGAASTVATGVSGVAGRAASYLPSASNVASGVSGVAGRAASYLPSASTVATGVSDVAGKATSYLPSADKLKFWGGSGQLILKNAPTTLEYNKLYPVSNTNVDITIFDKQLNDISFLTKSERLEFNNSKLGKNLNALKKRLDKLLVKQLDIAVQQKELRVSMLLIIMDKLINIIHLNIPTFKNAFFGSIKTYKLMLKHDIELIDAKLLFPELLKTPNIPANISPLLIHYDNKALRHSKTLRHTKALRHNKSHSLNPLHINRFLKSKKSLKNKK
jgi:hypothetical protein